MCQYCSVFLSSISFPSQSIPSPSTGTHPHWSTYWCHCWSSIKCICIWMVSEWCVWVLCVFGVWIECDCWPWLLSCIGTWLFVSVYGNTMYKVYICFFLMIEINVAFIVSHTVCCQSTIVLICKRYSCKFPTSIFLIITLSSSTGHDHVLQHISWKGTEYITSGAGTLTNGFPEGDWVWDCDVMLWYGGCL